MTTRRIAKHTDHLLDDHVQIDRLPLWRPSTVERPISVDDIVRAFHVIDNPGESLAGLLDLGWFAAGPSQAGLGIEREPRNPPLDLLRQPRPQFSPHSPSAYALEIS